MRHCVIIELTVNHCTDTPFGSSQYKKPLSLRLSKMKGKVWKFDNRKKEVQDVEENFMMTDQV